MADVVLVSGDVLIAKRESDGLFELSIVPGRPQLSVRVEKPRPAESR